MATHGDKLKEAVEGILKIAEQLNIGDAEHLVGIKAHLDTALDDPSGDAFADFMTAATILVAADDSGILLKMLKKKAAQIALLRALNNVAEAVGAAA